MAPSNKPPGARRGPTGKRGPAQSALSDNGTACICQRCVSVDLEPIEPLEAFSPLARFVGGRVRVLGGVR